jgi:CHAT domain-containing protein
MLAVVAVVVLPRAESSPFGDVPPEHQAYYDWVASISQGPSEAITAGVATLEQYPTLRHLYMRLADLCVDEGREEACAERFAGLDVASEREALYRRAALVVLKGDEATEQDWLAVAASGELDVPLARRIVDASEPRRSSGWYASLSSLWAESVARDSARSAAPAFGLGYAAALNRQWSEAEPMLERARTLAPSEPDVYRELGRIYFSTGQSDAYEEALREGIEAARRTYDAERELVLRGNLALSLIQSRPDQREAEVLLTSALDQSRELADAETEGFNLYRLGQLRYYQYRYAEALALLDSAQVRYEATVPHRTSEVFAFRGAVLRAMVRLSEADRELSKAMEHAVANNNLGGQLQTLLARAQLRLRSGAYAEARSDALALLDMATRYRQADAEMTARFVLGRVERGVGNFSSSREHFEAGLERAQTAQNEGRIQDFFTELGTLSLQTFSVDDAHRYFEQSTQSAANAGGVFRAHIGLGRTYKRYDELDTALDHYEKAYQHSTTQPQRYTASLAMAWVRLELGELDAAAELFGEIARSNAPPTFRMNAALGEARVALVQERYEDALQSVSDAALAQDEFAWFGHAWFLSYLRALTYQGQGAFDEAKDSFEQATALVEAARYSLSEYDERSTYIQDKVVLYEDYAAMLRDLGEQEEAMRVTERARSRGLLDLLYASQRSEASDSDGVGAAMHSVALWQRQRALADELAELHEQTGELGEAEQTRASFLRSELAAADSLYKATTQALSSRDQAYVYDPIQPEAAREMLEEGEAMVLYDLASSEERGQSVAYVVTKTSVTTVPLPVETSALPDRIRFLRGQIGLGGTPGANWEGAARQLHGDLVEPLLVALPADIEHLHLIPEGVLHYVPFAALLDANQRFLVERFTLSVAPSATVLHLSRERNPRQWRSMLLVADPTGRLPGSRREAQEIASVSTSRRLALLGEQASEQLVTEIAPNYDVLHFATHGTFSNQAPWRSHLELHDDVLNVADISRLELDAYLVTLSACETALGAGASSDVPPGDEWIGLHQAFLAAGTPSVLATLWIIDDKASSSFMIDFYDRLAMQSKAQALAQTQRSFIASSDQRHPFYWAPFVLVGDPL